MLVIFYAPLVFWLLWKLWRALPRNPIVRVSVTAVALLIATAIPLWDVVITSVRMAELCPQAGIFVKRSVKVDGFFTDFAGEDTLKKGFNYIERLSSGDRIILYTRDGNAVKKEEFGTKQYQVKSRYEFIYKDIYARPLEGYLIDVSRSVVRDRVSGEEIGYSLRYTAFPGWFDRNTVGRLGRIQWSCPDISGQRISLFNRVLLPNETITSPPSEGGSK